MMAAFVCGAILIVIILGVICEVVCDSIGDKCRYKDD